MSGRRKEDLSLDNTEKSCSFNLKWQEVFVPQTRMPHPNFMAGIFLPLSVLCAARWKRKSGLLKAALLDSFRCVSFSLLSNIPPLSLSSLSSKRPLCKRAPSVTHLAFTPPNYLAHIHRCIPHPKPPIDSTVPHGIEGAYCCNAQFIHYCCSFAPALSFHFSGSPTAPTLEHPHIIYIEYGRPLFILLFPFRETK